MIPGGQSLAEEEEHVKIKIIPNCGHQIFFDQPLKASKYILQFAEES